MTPRFFRLAPFLALLALPAGGSAQERACPDGVISYVFVDNHSIFDPQELAEEDRFRWAYDLVNTLHVRTRQRFIRREILFSSGDCYDPLMIEESERLLRAYTFIADADVFGLRQEDGSWHVVVETEDEWTTQLDLGVSFQQGLRLEKLALTERSFLGWGILLGGFVRERDQDRDVGMRLEMPRLGGYRADARFSWGRTRAGDFLEQGFFYPFVGEVGRVAGRQVFLRRESLFPYSLGAGSDHADDVPTHVLLPTDEQRFEITLAGRIGTPGNLTLFGIGVSNETLEFPGFPGDVEVAIDRDFGDPVAADSATAARVAHQTLHSAGTRVNFLVGQRNVHFRQFRGLDALRGTQDIPIGVDVGLTLGRSVAALSAGENQPNDLYTRLKLSLTASPDPFLLGLFGSVEARKVFSGGDSGSGWDDVLAELDMLFYWQPRDWPRHTFFAKVAGVGGWRVTQPYQVTLGGPIGVRGYHEDDFPGGRRIVFSAEDRVYLGWPFPELFDLGLTLFADIGSGWAGDAPYGVDTGWRGTLGTGLRVGFPAGSRGVVRLDVAWPLESQGLGTPFLRIAVGDPLGISAGVEDPQLGRSRRLAVGPDLFTERPR